MKIEIIVNLEFIKKVYESLSKGEYIYYFRKLWYNNILYGLAGNGEELTKMKDKK